MWNEDNEDNKREWFKVWTSDKMGKGVKSIVLSAYLRNTPEAVMFLEGVLVDIMNYLKSNRTEAITSAMVFCLVAYRDYLKDGTGNQDDVYLDMLNEMVAEEVENAKIKYIHRVYERKGLEACIEACNKYQLDPDELLSRYTMSIDRGDKSSEIRVWLESYFENGDVKPVHQIKQDIIEDGVVSPSEWGLVKNVASTDGYSSAGKRGFWSKPNKVS
jgi:hypothetical protein